MTHRRLLIIYSVHQTLHWFETGLIVPIFTLLQLEKGLNLFQIGLTVAVLSGTVIAFELPTGGLADSIGRKKVYIYSLLVKSIGIVVLLFARSFLFVIISFLFSGISRALSSGSMDAWFVDEFNRIKPKGNLQSSLATVGVFIPIGLGIGSIVGGILPDTIGKIAATVQYFDIYSSNLLAMALLLLIQLFYTGIIIEDHFNPSNESGAHAGFRNLPQVLTASIKYGIQNRIVLMLLISTAALGLALSGLENFWQPQLKWIIGENSKTWIFGLLSAGYFFSASVGNLIITPICRLLRNRYVEILFASRIFMGGDMVLTRYANKDIRIFNILYSRFSV